MSRATSIAGVRPLGWLARLRAQSCCLVWACPAQLLGGWRGRCGAGANHGAADEYLCSRPDDGDRQKLECARCVAWRELRVFLIQ